MAVPVSESRYGDFRPVSGTTGATIHVLNQEANRAASMKLLQEAGLRPYTYQEMIPLLMKDERLKNSLKNKRFYLAGSETYKVGLYAVDEKGELADIGKRKLSVEEKVLVWSGKNPLALAVGSDDDAANYGGRFGLDADCDPRVAAPVVVGTPSGREATAPKAAGSLAESVQAELTKVQARRTEIKEAFDKEDEQLAKRENELKDALPKAKDADKAKAQAKDLIRDAEDSEKLVMATLRGASKNA